MKRLSRGQEMRSETYRYMEEESNVPGKVDRRRDEKL